MTGIDPIKLAAIRNALLACAKAGTFPSYSQLGAPLGIHPRWPSWKKYLDEISTSERANGRPDLTWIVRSTRTNLPGQMDFKRVTKPDATHRARAKQMVQPVIDTYCPPGTANPYA
jgi:hypothetical protein